MSQAVTDAITSRPRFGVFRRNDDTMLLAQCKRFEVQRRAIERLHDQYVPGDPPAALLHAMHEALEDAQSEIAAIAATTRAGLRGKAGVLLLVHEDFAGEDCSELCRSLATDVAAI